MEPNPFSSPEAPDEAAGSLPSPSAAVALFGAALLLNLALGFLFAAAGWNAEWLLVVTPFLLIALTLAGVVIVGADPRKTLLLRPPSGTDVLMALPLALSLFVLNDQLSTLTQALVPLPEEITESLAEILRVESPWQWVFKLSTISVAAAISEELCFRGFIQNAFLARMRRSRAVVWTAFLFMLLHTLPLPSYAAAGIVLGITAVGARSIVVPIVAHGVNNAAALALINVGGLDTLADPLWTPPSILLPAFAIFVISIGYFLRRMPDTYAEPSPAPAGRGTATGNGPDEPESPRHELDPLSSPMLAELSRPSIRDELAGVSKTRQRLGWLVVAVSLVVGLFVLIALIVFSAYTAQPERMQAAFIEALEQLSIEQLAPDARGRSEELQKAFESLAEANDRGGVSLEHLWGLTRETARLTADSVLDEQEVDELLAAIRHASGLTDAPRRL